MKHQVLSVSVVAFILWMMLPPPGIQAASAPHKAVFTFGGLNERSGVLFVARDAGIFQKNGLDATVVNVRNAAIGMSALTSGETQLHVGSATGSSIGAMAGGLDLAFIAGLINKLDGTFVVAPKIKTPAELKGKRIGVQSIGGGVWMFSMLAFEKWGLNPERDKIQFAFSAISRSSPRRSARGSSTVPIWVTPSARKWNGRVTGYWRIWPKSAFRTRDLGSWPGAVW